ncbi:MAG: class A beta-lactamase-related serine hydrolase [Clostridia bacterium]|nr:class A beta-lactamase-related serine hydrolase [Clostridia bacterium]MDY5554444.1 serine hydrolase [Blautia sp.]
MNNNKSQKPVFLYIVIVILSISLAALGVITFLSLNRLSVLQEKVSDLSDTVEEISQSADTLVSQADQLEDLKIQESQLQSENVTALPQQGPIFPSNNTSFSSNTDESMDSLLSQVKIILPQNNGTWSVYVCNLLKNTEGVINNTPMQAAGLIRLFIMGTVYENYSQLTKQYGSEALDSNLSAMVTSGDNNAADTLVKWLGNGSSSEGMARVNQFCQNHGYADTHMSHMLSEGNENGENYTTARDCGAFLKEVYQICNDTASNPSLSSADAMYYLLKMQQDSSKIPAGIPEGVHIANETGQLDAVENDAAIIYDSSKGIDLVICFMSQDLSDSEAARSAIAEDAHAIYGYYNE